MAAIVHPVPTKDRRSVARPPLRVIEGGRSPRRLAARYRRRRAVALVVVVAVAGLAVAGGYAAFGALRPDVPGAGVSGVAVVSGARSGAVVVVRRGDTLWSTHGASHRLATSGPWSTGWPRCTARVPCRWGSVCRLAEPACPHCAENAGSWRVTSATCAVLHARASTTRWWTRGRRMTGRRSAVVVNASACGRRFTTFERLEEVPLVVVKRSGDRQPFDRDKIVAGLLAATKNRPISVERLDGLAAEVEERVRLDGPELHSERIGMAVLEGLRELDHGCLRPLRQRLQGVRRPRRLRARGRAAHQVERPEEQPDLGAAAPGRRRGAAVVPRLRP